MRKSLMRSIRSISVITFLLLANFLAAQDQKTIQVQPSEIAEIYANIAEHRDCLYIGEEASPLVATLRKMMDLSGAPQSSSIDELNNRLMNGCKTAPRDLMLRVAQELRDMLQECPAKLDDQSVAMFARDVDLCSSLIEGNELLIVRAPQERAPRFPEPAGIENPTLTPEEGTAVCCPLPRDGNFIGDLYVGGNLTVVGTISGSIMVNPPLILQPAVGSQACIIFEESVGDGGAEQARLCSSAISGDKGLFISVDAGVTENFRVANNGDTTLANNLNLQNSSSSAVGNITKGGSRFIHNFGTTSTFVGVDAGNFTNTGTANTGVGVSALTADTTGNNNSAFGRSALAANTTGSDNSAFGRFSLSSNTTGIQNTAIGSNALAANLVANNITAVGYNSLTLATAGPNTAVGANSLAADTTGINNVAVGSSALTSNTTASNNTAVGFDAAALNTTGAQNTTVGASSLRANLSGSNNAALGYNALNANTASNNTAVGSQALALNTTGINNSAFGSSALAANTTANNNTAVGFNAAAVNTTGVQNTAVGASTLASNSTGTNNVAIGFNALASNTTATTNVAVGSSALSSNSTGNANTALGHAALTANTVASSNTAVGANALTAQTGVAAILNTAVGASALIANQAGDGLTAVGAGALSGNVLGIRSTAVGTNALTLSTGGLNTAIGYSAGSAIVAGTNNICIGANQTGLAGDVATTRIGVQGTQAACFIAGIVGATTGINDAIPVLVDSAGQLGTVSSSLRYKENIADLANSLDRFMQLRPVQFNYKDQNAAAVNMGLIAEEVAALYPELVVYNENGEPETIKYHLLYALLIKMIQENTKEIEALKGQTCKCNQ